MRSYYIAAFNRKCLILLTATNINTTNNIFGQYKWTKDQPRPTTLRKHRINRREIERNNWSMYNEIRLRKKKWFL